MTKVAELQRQHCALDSFADAFLYQNANAQVYQVSFMSDELC